MIRNFLLALGGFLGDSNPRKVQRNNFMKGKDRVYIAVDTLVFVSEYIGKSHQPT